MLKTMYLLLKLHLLVLYKPVFLHKKGGVYVSLATAIFNYHGTGLDGLTGMVYKQVAILKTDEFKIAPYVLSCSDTKEIFFRLYTDIGFNTNFVQLTWPDIKRLSTIQGKADLLKSVKGIQ